MESPTSLPERPHDALPLRPLKRALHVLAEATVATTVLFDAAGRVVVGPVAGSDFVRCILASERGRELILSLHRSATDPETSPRLELQAQALAGALEYLALPLMIDGQRIGTLTLGDRFALPIPAALLEQVASAIAVDPGALQASARDLPLWSESESARARTLAILLVELLGAFYTQDTDLQRRIAELSAVYNISSLVTGVLDLQEVLDKIAELVCTVMKVKACSIRLLDEATGHLAIKAVHNLSEEYLNKGPVTVDRNPIDAAAVAGELVHIADAPSDPRTSYPQQARKEGIVSGLVSGMIYRGKPVGVLRVYTGEPYVFSPFEESLLQAVASQAAAAIVNARLFAEALEAERYQRQLDYAGEVQRRMIPSAPPCCKQVEIGAVYRPTFQVGGDFYDFIVLPKENLGIAIADVSGKGVPASLLMASVRSALRVNAYHTYDIDRILSEVNQLLCHDTTIGEFATVFYGVIAPSQHRLTYCNAGHDPPMLLRGGQVQYLQTGGMVLGVDPNATFDRGILDLQSGDVLLLYTDGAAEALNFTDEPFGRQRLADSFRRYADQPPQRIAENILWDIRRFRGLADRTDDLTLVVLKINGTSE